MSPGKNEGFSMVELLVVLFMIGMLAYMALNVLSGWRERNAMRMVSQDLNHLFGKYRQKAIDKGYNYGIIISDDGVYAFEDNGGTGAGRFQNMNNFAIDPGEYSDMWRGGGLPDRRQRRVSQIESEYEVFSDRSGIGRIMAFTTNELILEDERTHLPYETPAKYADKSSSFIVPFSGSDNAPFSAGSRAVFFSPDGMIYFKDPTVPIQPINKYTHQLGGGTVSSFLVIRVAYDDTYTAEPEIGNYYEISLNRYGSSEYVKWVTVGNDGTTWNAEVQ